MGILGIICGLVPEALLHKAESASRVRAKIREAQAYRCVSFTGRKKRAHEALAKNNRASICSPSAPGSLPPSRKAAFYSKSSEMALGSPGRFEEKPN